MLHVFRSMELLMLHGVGTTEVAGPPRRCLLVGAGARDATGPGPGTGVLIMMP